jgi:hypothetical protein
MEIADTLIAIGIGAALTLVVVGIYIWVLWQRLKTKVDRLVEEIMQEAENSMIGLDIEVDRGTYFCYNTEDKQFICQGATVDEIRQAFQSRYPDKTAYLAGGDPAVVEHFKTELLRLSTNENSTGQ